MKWPLLQRRTMWWPTRVGWVLVILAVFGSFLAWGLWGESFLSPTDRLEAQVLVVEGWAGRASMAAAVQEFRRGGYERIICAGGPTGVSWAARDWNYADLAADELVRLGLPKDRVFAAPAEPVASHRTYTAAQAVQRAFTASGNMPNAVNLWARGVHARRSWLVFSKVLSPSALVGVISWQPQEEAPRHWWQSSERARDLLEETVAYWFEKLLGSGRFFAGLQRSGVRQMCRQSGLSNPDHCENRF